MWEGKVAIFSFFPAFQRKLGILKIVTQELHAMKLSSVVFSIVLASSATFVSIGQAEATTLTSNVNVDNMFIEYLSPNANSLVGATVVQQQITSGGGVNPGWQSTYTNNSAVISGQSEYLIVQAINVGGPGAFLGDFSLSNAAYHFANGTQSISTGDSAWSVAITGSLGPYYGTTTGSLGTFVSATIAGQNGVSPWGSISGINGSSSWISDASGGNYNGGYNTSYFETKITSATPLPAALFFVAPALAGVFGFSRRKAANGLQS
jgi:hypothetical protein